MQTSVLLRLLGLEIAVLAVGGGGLYVSIPLTVLVLWPATGLAGLILTLRAVARMNRSGQGVGRAITVIVLMLLGFTLAWLVLLGIVSNVIQASSLGAALGFLWAPSLGMFSVGLLAALDLGPFRSKSEGPTWPVV